MSRMNIINNRYGHLIVLKEVGQIGKDRRFLCKCDCGSEKIVRMSSLRSGNTKSCGCIKPKNISKANLKDLTGKQFGKLTVIKRSKEKRNNAHIFWECRCICEKIIIVDGSNLISGNTKSCGCTRKKRSE